MSPTARLLNALEVKSLATELGFDAVGIAPAHEVTHRDLYLSWLASGYAADMAYLQRYTDQRFHPRALLSGAQSVLVVGLNYSPAQPDSSGGMRVAKYAWGEDYHRVLRRLLRRLRSKLRLMYPGMAGRLCVDTAPFPDKYWAVQAGLGWQGKHTNLVSREHGSYLVLGSLIVDIRADEYAEPHADYCGSCDACLTACPTSAFPAPYVLDARRCLSYWTIETLDTPLPAQIESKLGEWVFGCDACLDVCPWNKFGTPTSHVEFDRTEATALCEEGRVDELGEAEFDRLFEHTPMKRAGRAGLIRNQAAAQRQQGSRV